MDDSSNNKTFGTVSRVSATAEMNTHERIAFLDSILASSTEYAIIAKDLNETVLAWNEGARRIYGYEPEEVIGKRDTFLYDEEDLKNTKVKHILEKVCTVGEWSGEIRHKQKNGTLFIAFVNYALRKDPAGKATGFTMISRDMTQQIAEQKRLEEQTRAIHELEEKNRSIQEANRLKNEFLTNMSHELRTPLNAIIGFSTLMYNEVIGAINEEQKSALADVISSSKNLLRIINDLLDLSKLEHGELEFKPEEIDLQKIYNDVITSLRPIAIRKNIMVSATVNDIPDIYLDASRLRQILQNYISNALKFTPEDGEIQVRILPESETTFRIEVEDSGIGIKPEDISRLFVPFQQLDAGLARRYSGTGLGLSLTKEIVELQGGMVGVDSTYGKGSVFFAIMPRRYIKSE